MQNDVKICSICNKPKLKQDIVPASNDCFGVIENLSSLCYDCVCETLNFQDLNHVDNFCKFLNIGFDANEWIKLTKQCSTKKEVLETYVKPRINLDENGNWTEQNLIWEKAREMDRVMSKLPELQADMFLYLRKKWGSYDDFGVEDYLKMEAYEKNTLNYYNFRDEARRDMIRKLALVSILIDKKLAAGDTREVATLISSYQSLMKESGIQNAVSNDTETIESLSELIAFLEKNNWLMDYKVTESRDIVDATIRNFQQYVQSLVTGSGEEISQMYSAKQMEEQSGTELSEEDIESMFETQESEEELLDDEFLSEEELIEMFKGVGKQYD